MLLLSSLAASVELGPDLPARPQQKKDKTPTEIRRETPDSKERPRNKTKAGARKVPGIVADPLLADRSKPESGSLEAISVAAEGGDAVAQVNLGFLYASGEGVPQNFAEAARWYRKAADQGHADAQYKLGFLYTQGQGVPKNFAEAYFWLNLASAGWSYVNPVSEYAKARDIAAERFSPYELSAIQERCSKWMDDFERRKTLESIQVAAPPVFPTQRAIE